MGAVYFDWVSFKEAKGKKSFDTSTDQRVNVKKGQNLKT